MDRAGTNRALRRPPCWLARSARGGASPPGAGCRHNTIIPSIIYALVIVINNCSQNKGRAEGRSPPPASRTHPTQYPPASPTTSPRIPRERSEPACRAAQRPMSRYTQTSTPSTNPYNSNSRRAHTRHIM